MINTMRPASTPGHDDKNGEVLDRISREYGKGDPKEREAVKKLGKDEFFKLMITQMSHQDPLKPYDNEQMAAQMAQFTALEQMTNVNQNLEKLAAAQAPIANMGAANLIGKYVTSDSSRILHNEGKYTTMGFDLPTDADSVHVSLINEKGETVREFEKSHLKQGPNKIDWDGKKANGMLAPSGTYMMNISAVNDRGKQIQVKTTHTEVVHGVAFEGKDTVLLTGSLANPTKTLLRNVTKIIDASQATKANAAVTGPGGMQITGLENVLGAGGLAEKQGVPPQAQPPAQAAAAELPPTLDLPEERTAEGQVGQNAKFAPIDMAAMRKAAEQPTIVQPPSQEELRRMIDRPDLSGANMAEDARRAGKLSSGNSVPSGADGSVAGKLTE